MTDFRALCAELLEALENAIRVVYGEDGTKHISTADPVIAKADAALAQPEPPVDGEVAELVAWLRTNADYSLQKAATATFKRFHRIADLLERLAQPEPQGPTNEELVELFNENDWNYISPETFLDIARSVLELR